MRPARLVAVAAVAAVLSAGAPAVLADAATRPAAGTERVLLLLAPRDEPALSRLAESHGLSHRSRIDRLAQLLPSSVDRERVETAARSHGLTVVRVSPLAVLVNGPAAVVTRLFGSARAVQPRARLGRPLPRIPADLGGLVAAAYGGDETRPAARPLAGCTTYSNFQTVYSSSGGPPQYLTGANLRQAYGVSAVPNPNSLGLQTIASIQLADWPDAATTRGAIPSDLATYAKTMNIPIKPGQYAGIVVDPSDPPVPDPGTTESFCGSGDGSVGGSDEVALDQETLLGVAPTARQRVYASGNDTLGEIEDFLAVGDDASNGVPISALTVSWGQCETNFGTQSDAQNFDSILAYVDAAGVTIFAPSGDNGTTDCSASGNPTGGPAVDLPAASPHVIGVGGTVLALDPADNTQTTETAWACSANSPSTCSGGGASSYFAQPGWQTGVAPAAKRLVPDIASAADPGFAVVSTENCQSGSPPSCPEAAYWSSIGATSLAAPTQAALLADELIAHGIVGGLGDIHPQLYRGTLAPRPAGSPAVADFQDINDGGSNADAGNPGFVAGNGYDEVTGLGTPNWDRIFADVLGTAMGTRAVGHGDLAVVRTFTGGVYSWKSTSGGFAALGGNASSLPVLASVEGQNFYLAVTSNHQPWIRSDTTGWTRLVPKSTVGCGDIAAFALPGSGDLYVACVNPSNHEVYIGYATFASPAAAVPTIDQQGLGAFTGIGGYATSGPAVAEIDGTVEAFVDGPGSGPYPLYEQTVRVTPAGGLVGSGWHHTPFSCYDRPALAVEGTTLGFGCSGAGHHLYYATTTTGAFTPVANFGGGLVGGVGLSDQPNASQPPLVTAYVEGTNGHLYSRRLSPTVGPWVPHGGGLAGGASATAATIS
ncbi:MAG TPA: S53 family peptidase [Mycobacteriales bacterium]|nr:S53 family peptidase [Mycobacteriales bacterium]